jgi:hypothetical protein
VVEDVETPAVDVTINQIIEPYRKVQSIEPETAAPNVTVKPAEATPVEKSKIIFAHAKPGFDLKSQCERLARNYDFVHVSVEELLRESGSVVCEKLGEEIQSTDKTYLVEGFPRHIEHLFAWIKHMSPRASVDFVLYLEHEGEAAKEAGDEFVIKTMPIIGLYEKLGKVRTVKTGASVEETFENIKAVFSDFTEIQKEPEIDAIS